jgi:hypothetical protein
VFEENHLAVSLYNKTTDVSITEMINYESMLKDMIFYDLSSEYIIKTLLEEMRIYG